MTFRYVSLCPTLYFKTSWGEEEKWRGTKVSDVLVCFRALRSFFASRKRIDSGREAPNVGFAKDGREKNLFFL